MCVTFSFIWHKTGIFRNIFYFIWPNVYLPRPEEKKQSFCDNVLSTLSTLNYLFKSSTGKCYCSNTGIKKKKNKRKNRDTSVLLPLWRVAVGWQIRDIFCQLRPHICSRAAEGGTPQNSCGHISSCLQQPLAEGVCGRDRGNEASQGGLKYDCPHLSLKTQLSPELGQQRMSGVSTSTQTSILALTLSEGTRTPGPEQWLMPKYIFAILSRRSFLGRHLGYLFVSPTICNQSHYTWKAWPSCIWTTVL